MESNLEHVSPLTSRPNPEPNPNHCPLRAAKSTAFKREERRKRKERKRQECLALELAQWDPLGVPRRPATATSPAPFDTPWPCDPAPPPDPAASRWSWGPPVEPKPGPPLPSSAAAATPQAAAATASRAFFACGEEDEVEEEEEEGKEEGEGNVVRFFEELFEKDAGLRGFYEEEWEKGEFLCLVCEGVGARTGKRFAGCSALVQHAGSIARTKRRLAHRAFGYAVRRLLGWGAGRAPVLSVGSNNRSTSYPNNQCDPLDISEMEMSSVMH